MLFSSSEACQTLLIGAAFEYLWNLYAPVEISGFSHFFGFALQGRDY